MTRIRPPQRLTAGAPSRIARTVRSLRGGERQREHEHQQDQSDRRDHECQEGSAEPTSRRERLPGQTDQDRTCSPEPREQVPKPEERDAEQRALASHLRLTAQVSAQRRFELAQVDRQASELDQP